MPGIFCQPENREGKPNTDKMKRFILNYFSEEDEIQGMMESYMEDPEIVLSYISGEISDGEKILDLDKLEKKCTKAEKIDYDRMINIIERLKLMDVLKGRFEDHIRQNDDMSSAYEYFYEETADLIRGYAPKEKEEKRLFIIVRIPTDKKGRTYQYTYAKPSDLTEIMSEYPNDEMVVYKCGKDFELDAGNNILRFVDITDKIEEKVKKTANELTKENNQEMKYLGIENHGTRRDLIISLIEGEVIDPYYEQNVKKGIYPIS